MNGRIILRTRARQRGAAAVEFGIIAIAFFTLFFGIIEFGRFFYLYNTVQEVTRCAARQAVVTWKDDWYTSDLTHVPPIIPIPRQCMFGHDELVAGWEIHGWEMKNANVRLRALNLQGGLYPNGNSTDEANPTSIVENISNCATDLAGKDCIRFVEASVQACNSQGASCQPIQYQPNFIPLRVNIPNSTVIMPAESLGYGA